MESSWRSYGQCCCWQIAKHTLRPLILERKWYNNKRSSLGPTSRCPVAYPTRPWHTFNRIILIKAWIFLLSMSFFVLKLLWNGNFLQPTRPSNSCVFSLSRSKAEHYWRKIDGEDALKKKQETYGLYELSSGEELLLNLLARTLLGRYFLISVLLPRLITTYVLMWQQHGAPAGTPSDALSLCL